MIQGKMGENALSKVCTTYPRHMGGVAGRKIEVATLSCPEAARLCLLDPNAMKLGESKISSGKLISISSAQQNLSAIRYLHQTAVEMLEDDRVSIIEFVLVYGSALSMLRKRPELAFTEDQRFSEMQSIITLVRTSLADSHTNAVQAREAAQFQLGKVLPILVRHARNNLRNTRFRKSFLNSLSGIVPGSIDVNASAELYLSTVNTLTINSISRIKSALNNYLINDLLKNLELYSSSPIHALRGLQAAVVRISIFFVQFIGAKLVEKSCCEEELLPLIVSSTARALEHNPAVMVEIASYLDNIEDKSVALLGLITPRL
jgi:lysine-N-methylase